ncbi:cobalamin biosynthesis protein [Streptomyces kunmingensis]|uniref:Cobalamin biosynthesis protein n=1 Tax=Streptomyces kunmingensis TaxID=68225 RepID=A0ABU6CBX1_9ACTN|nr:cobalamin biosynthesis protein [Streptomyces kunmingensis]MEB3962213.1 cobalamin biosynthesis protein [Streptomyces kunmingensis]
MIVGVGARAGVTSGEVLGLVRAVLDEAGAGPDDVVALATVDTKGNEPGIVGAAGALKVPLVTYAAGVLAGVPVPHPSDRVRGVLGTPSVAEAAALAGGGQLVVPKRVAAGRVTCAVARGG